MPTNANTFNSRVTSEALEAKFREVFPAQGGAELVQDLFASGVIQPVVDFSSVAEGSVLPENLQTAWDFATQAYSTPAGGVTNTLITNTGFWKVGLSCTMELSAARTAQIYLTDGLTNRPIWIQSIPVAFSAGTDFETDAEFVVFINSGQSLVVNTSAGADVDVWYRQIADLNGNLVNPLGFTFS